MAAVCSECGMHYLGGGMSSHVTCRRKKKRYTPKVSRYASDKTKDSEEVNQPKESHFQLSSIKFPSVKYNNYFSFDKDTRCWTSNVSGREIIGVWRTCTEDCNYIYIENTVKESFVKISISYLIDKDKKYVLEKINEMKRKGFVWWQGGFFSETDIKNIKKAEQIVLKQSKETLIDVPFKTFQILNYGALATFGELRSYGISYNTGKVFFLSADLNGMVSDTEQMKGKLFWASTYTYINKDNERRVVDRYVTSFPRAVFFVRARMNLYDESSWDYGLFQELAEGDKSKREIDESSQKNKQEPVLCSTGSGFFVTTNGYLVTNYHVIENGKLIKILTDKGIFEAKLIKIDPATDLALLKIESNVKPCRFSKRRIEKLGMEIFTMGFPMPGLQGFSPKVTKGIISGTDGFKGDVRRYQIDATIQPGNSGGPLFDNSGNIVGVLVSSLAHADAQAVNYAIKKSYLMAFLDGITECAADLEEADDNPSTQLFEVVSSVVNSCALIMNYQ
jgi:S1-C subfamily serine protease